MDDYVIFDTAEEWQAYEDIAYPAWMSSHNCCVEYSSQTDGWSSESKRDADGKWVAPVCPDIEDHSSYTIEQYDGSWFVTDYPT